MYCQVHFFYCSTEGDKNIGQDSNGLLQMASQNIEFQSSMIYFSATVEYASTLSLQPWHCNHALSQIQMKFYGLSTT